MVIMTVSDMIPPPPTLLICHITGSFTVLALFACPMPGVDRRWWNGYPDMVRSSCFNVSVKIIFVLFLKMNSSSYLKIIATQFLML